MFLGICPMSLISFATKTIWFLFSITFQLVSSWHQFSWRFQYMNHQYQILEGRPCQSSHQKDFIPILSSYEATCFLEVGLQAFDFYWLIGWGWELHNPTVTLPRKQHQRGLHSDRILGGQESLRTYTCTTVHLASLYTTSICTPIRLYTYGLEWYLSAFNLFPENLSNTTVISPAYVSCFATKKS